jgi:hypothetical protein
MITISFICVTILCNFRPNTESETVACVVTELKFNNSENFEALVIEMFSGYICEIPRELVDSFAETL